MDKEPVKPVNVAPLGRRFAAGLFDFVALMALMAALYFLPLLTRGLALPMWGVLAAVLGYAVVPLSAFRATLGMRIFGLELVSHEGHAPEPGSVLFRELIGRGYFPGAFLFTLLAGFVGSLLHLTHFAAPAGLAFSMAVVSALVVAAALPGNMLPVVREDGRSLADILARTRVVVRSPAAVVPDEEERVFLARRQRRRVAGVLTFEVCCLAAVVGLPWLLTRPMQSFEDLAARTNRERLERDFEAHHDNEIAARDLAAAYRSAGRAEDAAQVDKRLEEALAQGVGCDKTRALKLGDRYNQAGKYAEAVTFVEKFAATCGAWRRLEWVALYAHEQRKEWKEAVAIASGLIADDPEDSDFWWWRAQDRVQAGDLELAAVDYHQSEVQHPNGFAAGRYAHLASKLGRPCEAAFALRYWVDQRPDEIEDWVEPEISKLWLTGNCDVQAGKGAAKVSFLKGDKPAVLGTSKGTNVKLLAYPPAAYTVLSAKIADALKLDLSKAPSIALMLEGETFSAKLAVLPSLQLGKAQVAALPVAVVDAIPAGFDGYLGVNFVWRFHSTFKPGTLELKPYPERGELTRR